MSSLDKMLEQVKMIKNGIGVQAILDEGYRILGNPIAMNNTEYALLAYTEVETDDPIWHELIELGTFGEITQRFFEKAGFIEEVANNRIAFLTTPYLKYDRINGKLLSQNNTHISNLVTVACNKPFEEGDQMVFDAICKLMSKEISNNKEFAWYEQLHQEMLIKNLIDGNYDVKMDMAQVEILYGALDSHLYMAVVNLTTCSPKRCAVFFRDLFKKIKPEYKYAIYANFVVILISTNDDTLNVKNDLSELIKIFDEYNIYVGISGRFENMFEIQKHYTEASTAMSHVSKYGRNLRIFPYIEKSVSIMRQIEELENGKGIQYILNKGFEIFGNPFILHDMQNKVLVHSDLENVDTLSRDIITRAAFGNESKNPFLTDNFVETMEKADGGVFLVSDAVQCDRISQIICNKNKIALGCLSTVCTNNHFIDDSVILFGRFAEKFANETNSADIASNIIAEKF